MNALGARARGAVTGHPVAAAGLFLLTALLTRQSQFEPLNGLAAPLALVLVFAWMRWQDATPMLLPILLYTSCSTVASLFAGTDPASTVRFSVIVLGTLAAFCIRPRVPMSPLLPLLPLVIQCAVIVGVAVFLAVIQDPVVAAGVRATALSSGWGDVYSFDGLYYRVQLVGNALLPLLFMIALWRIDRGPAYRWVAVISLVALLAAGNLTYLLTAAIAAGIRFRAVLSRPGWGRWVIGLLIACGCIYGATAIQEAVERKFDGTDSSMGVRFDQIDAALEQAGDSPVTLLLGAGLGAPFPDGRERDYSRYQYIELQTLYLLYQLGIVGMLVYTTTLISLTRRAMSRTARTIFWLYVLSGITNPYLLDSNQIAATLLLLHLFPLRTAARIDSSPAGSTVARTGPHAVSL